MSEPSVPPHRVSRRTFLHLNSGLLAAVALGAAPARASAATGGTDTTAASAPSVDLALNRPVQVSSTDYAPTPGEFAVDGVWAAGSAGGVGSTRSAWCSRRPASPRRSCPAAATRARTPLSSATPQRISLSVPPGADSTSVVVNGVSLPVETLPGTSRRGAQVELRRGTNTITLRFSPIVPPTLLSQGCAVTASSTRTTDGNVVPANVVDGDTTTRWTSDYLDNQWIMIDLGATRHITDIKLDWEAAAGQDYDLAVSVDGQSWTTVATVTGNTRIGWLDYPGLNAQARYVRMDGATRLLPAYGFSLWEFQVFGQ